MDIEQARKRIMAELFNQRRKKNSVDHLTPHDLHELTKLDIDDIEDLLDQLNDADFVSFGAGNTWEITKIGIREVDDFWPFPKLRAKQAPINAGNNASMNIINAGGHVSGINQHNTSTIVDQHLEQITQLIETLPVAQSKKESLKEKIHRIAIEEGTDAALGLVAKGLVAALL